MRFVFRLIGLFSLIFLGFGLVLFFGLSAVLTDWDRTYQRARVLISLDRVVDRTARMQALGLSNDNMRQIELTLRNVVGDSANIVAADLFDRHGITVATSGSGSRGEVVPDSWLRTARADDSAEATWTGYGGLELVVAPVDPATSSQPIYVALLVKPPDATVQEYSLGAVVDFFVTYAAVAIPISTGGGAIIAVGLYGFIRQRADAITVAINDGAAPRRLTRADQRLADGFGAAAGAIAASKADLKHARDQLNAIDRAI